MNDSTDVTWHPADAPGSRHRLRRLYEWRHDDVPILNVRLSPSARIAAVQKLLPQERFDCSSVGFFGTDTWSVLWKIKVPFPPGNTNAHRVEVLFVSDERYVLTDVEIAMYEREHLRWKASVPLPSWPIEPWAVSSNPGEWTIVGSDAPTTDGEALFVPVHWARKLGPGGDQEGVWEDRGAIEVVSIHDGAWLRRIEPDAQVGPIPDIQRCVMTKDGGAEFRRGERLVGALGAPKGRRITSADVSLDAGRVVAVLDAEELLELVMTSQ